MIFSGCISALAGRRVIERIRLSNRTKVPRVLHEVTYFNGAERLAVCCELKKTDYSIDGHALRTNMPAECRENRPLTYEKKQTIRSRRFARRPDVLRDFSRAGPD